MSNCKTSRLCWGDKVPCGQEPTWKLSPVDNPAMVAYVCDEHLAHGVRKLGVPAMLDMTASLIQSDSVEEYREPAITRPALVAK